MFHQRLVGYFDLMVFVFIIGGDCQSNVNWLDYTLTHLFGSRSKAPQTKKRDKICYRKQMFEQLIVAIDPLLFCYRSLSMGKMIGHLQSIDRSIDWSGVQKASSFHHVCFDISIPIILSYTFFYFGCHRLSNECCLLTTSSSTSLIIHWWSTLFLKGDDEHCFLSNQF